MKQIDVIDLKKVLLKKGFRILNNDHEFFYLYVDNKRTSVRTKISFGSGYKTYQGNLLSMVKRQLKFVNNSDFDNFLECPMSYEQYIEHLVKNNSISIS